MPDTADAVQHRDQHEHDVQAEALHVHRREVDGLLRDDRDHLAVQPGGREGPVQIVVADRVEHDVEALAAGVLRCPVGWLTPAVIDDGVGPQRAGELRLVGTGGGGDHLGARRLGELHGDVADAAGAGKDEDVLASGEVRPVEQALPGGDGHQRQGRRLAPGELRRLGGEQRRVGEQILGQRTVHALHAAGAAIDLVADREPGDPGTDRLDDAGDVRAEHGRQCRGDRAAGAADLGVDRVHARGHHAHDDLARAGRRHRPLARLQHLRATEALDLHDTHVGLLPLQRTS